MATPNPDTTLLTTSSQVFKTHTLPQIRAIHKSLHVQIDEKSARLRTQVGNSYRELLGTADTIVTMKGEMKDAQEILGDMGGLCGRAVISDKVKSVSSWRERREGETGLGVVARVRLLEGCALSVGRLLKSGSSSGSAAAAGTEVEKARSRGQRLILAAKVLVLGRLLLSSFGDLKKDDGNVGRDVKEAVEMGKKTLASLRRRLLKNIDRLLEKVGTVDNRAEILNAMCAYSLASNSGAKDVMFHFLNVRAKVLAFEFNLEEHHTHHENSENVLRGLDLYTGTLLDVQALFPNKVSEALASLKRSPLLADTSLKALETFRLDIYERWCGDDIHHFTPFIQHNDLEGSQARSMLNNWAGKGAEILLSGIRETLMHTTEFKGIVDLRTNVLQHWIRHGGKAKGFDPSTVLDGLRKVINERLLAVLNIKVSKLRLVGSEISATLEGWRTGQTDRQPSLWNDDLLETDSSENANHFTQTVISRLHGRNEAVSRAVTSYQSWFQLVDDVGELVSQLKKQRWNNDVDEIEDEEVIEERQKMLSKEDPQKLQDQLDTSLQEGFKHLDEQLSEQWKLYGGKENSGAVAMYLLRILRDVRASLPKQASLREFGLDNVPELHEKLAETISASPVRGFADTTLPKRKIVGRALWEGEPTALPTNPSPGVFRLLRDLVQDMGDAGLDLWTPAAVRALKKRFGAGLVEIWRKELEVLATEKSEEKDEEEKDDRKKDTETDESEEKDEASESREAEETEEKPAAKSGSKDDLRKELLTQWVYDVDFLEQCLKTGDTSSSDSLVKLASDMAERAGLGPEEKNKLSKTCAEYWKRSSLLFGLLA